ncbi:hypothetical protein STEG23_029741 [Scotinomys teguina]
MGVGKSSRCLQRSEALDSPRAGIIGACEPPDMVMGTELGSMEGQSDILTYRQLLADMYVTIKVYEFSEQGDQTPMKMDGPDDAAFQNASVTVSSEFCIQNSFKAAR